MKEKLLLVIKDQLEFRFIINDYFVPFLIKNYDVVLMCPANGSQLFRESVSRRYPEIKFLERWFEKEVCLLDRVIYWLKNEFFFIINAPTSWSCFQKVFLNMELPLRLILRKNTEKVFFKIFSRVFKSQWLVGLLKMFLKLTSLLLAPLKKTVYSHRKFLSKISPEGSFDYIFFGRPYSLTNIAVYKAFAIPTTKIITLCRNFDAPALKGIFTIPSDYTIIFDSFLQEHLSSVNSPLNYGEVILYEHPVKSLGGQNSEGRNGVKNILYAASSNIFVPNEREIIEKLYSFLRMEFGEKFNLFIRRHPTDGGEKYSDLLLKNNVFIEKSYVSLLEDLKNGDHFPLPEDVENFYRRLKEMDIVLSSLSTINYEAFLVGVRTAYLKLDNRSNFAFERDHLRILVEKHGIPVITDLTELRKYL